MSEREYEEWYELHSWDPSRRTQLVIERELAPAAWIEPLLAPNSFEVRMTAPQGYDAYARIFFPFVGEVILEEGKPVDNEHVTWTEMARRNGRIAHALMEQETIRRPPNGEDVVGHGSYGSLMPEQFEALLPILTRHTSSASGWFLLWDGFGDLSDRAFNDDVPKIRHPARNFFLLKGPLGSYADLPHDPNYFWPDDRAWCLCTDTDFDWAYLAASAACVEEVTRRSDHRCAGDETGESGALGDGRDQRSRRDRAQVAVILESGASLPASLCHWLVMLTPNAAGPDRRHPVSQPSPVRPSCGERPPSTCRAAPSTSPPAPLS